MSALYWLSFADPKRPAGSQFLGVAIVRADDFSNAIRAAWGKRINPGGEVQGFELPLALAERVPADHIDRLLTRVECDVLNQRFDTPDTEGGEI